MLNQLKVAGPFFPELSNVRGVFLTDVLWKIAFLQ